MLSEPLISVLLPIYNGGNFLPDYLSRLTRQSYQNWELVVIDNASTDATADLLAAAAVGDSRIRIHRNPTTVSVIQNHNVAVRHISPESKYCKILHVDDSMDDSALSAMVAVAQRHPDAGLIVAWANQGDEIHGQIEPLAKDFFSGADIARRTLAGEIYPFLSPSCLLLRSDLVRARGDLYQIDDLHADIDSTYELLEHHDVGIAQAPLITIRDHAQSVTQLNAKPLNTLIAANFQMLVKHGPRFFPAAEFGKLVLQRRNNYLDFLARSALQGRDTEFWEFHRRVHAEAGREISVLELGTAIFRRIFGKPVWTLWALKHRLQDTLSTRTSG